MDQERNEMNAADGSAAPDAIRTDIERTREEMSETLGEIQERLSPSHLLQQAKDGVADAATTKARQIMHSASDTASEMAGQAQSFGRQTMSYARTHPTHAALVAGGLTWWLLRRAERSGSQGWNPSSDDWRTTRRPFDGGGDDPYRAAGYRNARDSRDLGNYGDASAASRVGESGEGFVASVRDTASEYADSARDSARRVTDKVRHAASDASSRTRQGWERTSTSVDQWVHDNPVAAGALALATGLAIGISAPRTAIEDRTMGEARDQALETAERKARELKDDVTQKVQQVANSVMDGGESGNGQQQPGSATRVGE